MKRLILLAMLAAWGAVSPLTMALDIGEPKVESSLDAPLKATVPLTDTDGFTAGDIRVDLAEPSAFRTLGLDWTSLTEDVSISLEGGSRPYLQLTSSTPVNDPWLDLLLTLETPDSRQTQVLTLLFDPPETPSVTSADAGSSRAISSNPVSAPTSSENSASADEPIYINRGDTLWGVAARVKPPEASVQQMMLALVEANERRFPSGNINDVRAGSSLEMPSDAAIFSQSPANAARAIEAMNTARRNRGNDPVQPASTASSPSATPSQTSVETGESATPSPDTSLPDVERAEAVMEGEGAAESNSLESVVSYQAIAGAQALNSQLREARLDDHRQQLDQLRQERELMQADIESLRNEVANLKKALTNAQPLARQRSSSNQPEEQSVDSPADQEDALAQAMAWGQSVYTLSLRDSRWPLAAAAILLLLLLLLLIRRRRAKEWQEVKPTQVAPESSDANSAIQRSIAAKAAYVPPETPPSAAAAPPASTQASGADEPDEISIDDKPSRFSAIEEARETQQVKPRSEDAPGEVAGSVESQPADLEPSQSSEWVSKTSTDSIIQEPADALKAESEDHLPARESAETEQQSYDNDTRKHVIDYQPPSLSEERQSEKDTETLMQPTVEFEALDQVSDQAENEPSARDQKRIDDQAASQEAGLDNDWEIEEVAFQRPGRDNTRSS